MIGYLTKDKEGYKLHDSFGAFLNENTKTWESYNSNMILREDSIEDSVKKLCTNKELKVLMHITPIADKYISTIEGIDWYNCKYLVKKHKDKKPKWYDWSEFELI